LNSFHKTEPLIFLFLYCKCFAKVNKILEAVSDKLQFVAAAVSYDKLKFVAAAVSYDKLKFVGLF